LERPFLERPFWGILVSVSFALINSLETDNKTIKTEVEGCAEEGYKAYEEETPCPICLLPFMLPFMANKALSVVTSNSLYDHHSHGCDRNLVSTTHVVGHIM
jgi:hypothetical protein